MNQRSDLTLSSLSVFANNFLFGFFDGTVMKNGMILIWVRNQKKSWKTSNPIQLHKINNHLYLLVINSRLEIAF